MRLLSVAVAAFAAATRSAMATECQYCSAGPCVPTASLRSSYQTYVDPGINTKLSLTVTIPGSSDDIKGPYPVIFYTNGFQARSGFYKTYAERMASWGYLVIQYNLPLFWIIPDANEVRYLDGLIGWLDEQNRNAISALHGIVDMDRLATAGHSRGAKLACLQFAGNRHIKAAYLVDPVDNTKQTPEGPDYPSGVMALNQLGKPVGISGAGIVGRCNPEGSNYKDFYGASAGKSWLTVVNCSSHTEFLDAGAILDKIIAGLCGTRGSNSFQETLRLTAPPLLAFMDSQLRAGNPDVQQRITDFYRFIDAEEAEDTVRFSIKPGVTRGTEEQLSAESNYAGQQAAHLQNPEQELVTTR